MASEENLLLCTYSESMVFSDLDLFSTIENTCLRCKEKIAMVGGCSACIAVIVLQNL